MKAEDIDTILAMDPELAIHFLKKRRHHVPDRESLFRDWDAMRHDVMDKTKRKDERVCIAEEKRDIEGNIITPAKFETRPVNRIAIPLEQDQVNIHTAFTVGRDLKMDCTPADDKEKTLLDAINKIDRKSKMKYQNKAIVRSWLSETEVAEYWYTVEDTTFWGRLASKLKNAVGLKSTRKLKSAVWSPFRGDKLYPLFDDQGDLIALSREYRTYDYVKEEHIVKFMTVTNSKVINWELTEGWKVTGTFNHNFSKMPIIYSFRKEGPLCKDVKPIRERIEKLLSDYADCIDYNFFPRVVVDGDIKGRPSKENGEVIQVENGGKVYYLTWSQTPESVRLELETLVENAYSMTNTPRISFENLKGIGKTSGTAFRFMFMGIHLAVSNHAEEMGKFFQRRYNFLTSAVGDLNPELKQASENIDIDVEIQPYMIDDMADNIQMALNANGGGKVASTKTSVLLAGIVDEVDEEVKLIEEESKMPEKTNQNAGTPPSE